MRDLDEDDVARAMTQRIVNVLEAIHTLQSELKKCEKMVEKEDWDDLNTWMQDANTLHDIL